MTTESLIFVGGMIFQAGGFYIYVRLTFNRLEEKVDSNFVTLDDKSKDLRDRFRSDLAGVGEKVTRIGTLSARRYHNAGIALMLSTPPEHEEKVAMLLKEENW